MRLLDGRGRLLIGEVDGCFKDVPGRLHPLDLHWVDAAKALDVVSGVPDVGDVGLRDLLHFGENLLAWRELDRGRVQLRVLYVGYASKFVVVQGLKQLQSGGLDRLRFINSKNLLQEVRTGALGGGATCSDGCGSGF